MLAAAPLGAQGIEPQSPDSQDIPQGPQFVSGQVVRPGKEDMIPVPRVMVTLHRVGNESFQGHSVLFPPRRQRLNRKKFYLTIQQHNTLTMDSGWLRPAP